MYMYMASNLLKLSKYSRQHICEWLPDKTYSKHNSAAIIINNFNKEPFINP